MGSDSRPDRKLIITAARGTAIPVMTTPTQNRGDHFPSTIAFNEACPADKLYRTLTRYTGMRMTKPISNTRIQSSIL